MAAAFIPAIVCSPPSPSSDCKMRTLWDYNQPALGESASEVVELLQASYSRWTTSEIDGLLINPVRCSNILSMCGGVVPIQQGSAPRGCSLGVRLSSDDLLLVIPVGETLSEYEQRTGDLFPRRAERAVRGSGLIFSPAVTSDVTRMTPSIRAYCSRFAQEHRVVGFEVCFISAGIASTLYAPAEEGRVYSKNEIVALIAPLARHGYVWCGYMDCSTVKAVKMAATDEVMKFLTTMAANSIAYRTEVASKLPTVMNNQRAAAVFTY
jgi:hypothetical protein